MRKRLTPEGARAEAARRYAAGHRAWWRDAAAQRWPLVLALGLPTEAEAAAEPETVRAWAEAWASWLGPGELRWVERQWPRLGGQRLPEQLVLGDADVVAELADEGPRWRRAVERRGRLSASLPADTEVPGSARFFAALADWPEADFGCLVALFEWVRSHPASGMHLRQLPVAGLDSKWVERHRGVVAECAAGLPWNRQQRADNGGGGSKDPGADAEAVEATAETARAAGAAAPDEDSAPSERDLPALLGLARAPQRLRMRVLCPRLRRSLGGLADIEAPLAQIAALELEPAQALVVENLVSGLALPERPGTVAFMKLGHGVAVLARIPWLRSVPLRYWGDIDTHGLAMVGRLRSLLPQTRSLLMDRGTLLAHRALWSEESEPWTGAAPQALDDDERGLFAALAAGTWGPGVRLEQERIPWPVVAAALDAPSGSTPLAAPTATAARAEAAAPSVPLAAATALPVDTEPTQLDIFADSDDVRRRNDFIEATLADDAERAQSCLRIWREAQPADALVAEAQALVEHLGAEANEPAREAATAPAVLDARSLLEQQVGPAAARVLGSAAGAWMTRRWRALAARARLLPWQPALAEAHAASLWLRAQDWAAASAAVAGIESWRRIPQPLLWMAEARWHADGADAAWPLLAEAFWLAPARAHALLERLADRRLLQAMQRFEDDFDSADEADWAWWPAWLAIEQPLLAPTLAAAEGSPDSEAAAGFRLVGALLRMEREGRHHEIVAARKQLRALQPRLFACYMRTR